MARVLPPAFVIGLAAVVFTAATVRVQAMGEAEARPAGTLLLTQPSAEPDYARINAQNAEFAQSTTSFNRTLRESAAAAVQPHRHLYRRPGTYQPLPV